MSSPERLNVLISWARNGLILVGNWSTFERSRKGVGFGPNSSIFCEVEDTFVRSSNSVTTTERKLYIDGLVSLSQTLFVDEDSRSCRRRLMDAFLDVAKQSHLTVTV